MFDINKIKEIEATEPTKEELEYCKQCGGKCCNSYGCGYIPSDFNELSFDYLKSKIDEGYISLDWYEQLKTETDFKEKGFFLRVRHVDAPIIDPSFGGVCCKLTEKGCSFSYKDRPFGGKTMKPDLKGGNCTVVYGSKEDIALMWLEHYDVLEKLFDYYVGEDAALYENGGTGYLFNSILDGLKLDDSILCENDENGYLFNSILDGLKLDDSILCENGENGYLFNSNLDGLKIDDYMLKTLPSVIDFLGFPLDDDFVKRVEARLKEDSIK